jgi:soluble lytic murein transglycosylase-like protein
LPKDLQAKDHRAKDMTARRITAAARSAKMSFIRTALAAIFTFSLAGAAQAASNICEREMARASRTYQVPLSMLYAVGLTETGHRGSLQPYAMNIEGRAFFGASLDQALRRFQEARQSGARLIDIGCMQIDHHYHASHFASLQEMFLPNRNVDYAAQFLKTLKAQDAGPNNNPAQKQYVCAVIANMVASGFGSWTANAKAFCQ